MAKAGWTWVKTLAPDQKAAIAATCERFIAEKLKPRFRPQIRPMAFNYPIDILGKWRGSKYSFITRYRSGFADNAGEEFDTGFARLDHREESLTDVLFDVMWYRHTGRWWRLYSGVPLEEALHLIEPKRCFSPYELCKQTTL
ncbi:hypothetical protein [Ensifer sp. BR816]|uniref:DUF3024 domain-containing protein n=1 Tax=Rhizobium sp. (strain BR816) TaxID=1057002 RepID=UPI00037C99DF|nr:hypothetical protein [Ensifer sp. BR816]